MIAESQDGNGRFTDSGRALRSKEIAATPMRYHANGARLHRLRKLTKALIAISATKNDAINPTPN